MHQPQSLYRDNVESLILYSDTCSTVTFRTLLSCWVASEPTVHLPVCQYSRLSSREKAWQPFMKTSKRNLVLNSQVLGSGIRHHHELRSKVYCTAPVDGGESTTIMTIYVDWQSITLVRPFAIVYRTYPLIWQSMFCNPEREH